jgi:molybdopterin molybdotransferase
MMARRTLAEYQSALLKGVEQIAAMEVLITDAAGSILAEDLASEGPLPPVAIATCDGYAVTAKDVASASEVKPVELAVSHDVGWDARGPRRHVAKTAARIVSGAPMPVGADAVLPVGATDGGVAAVRVHAPTRSGANVRAAGAEAAAGKVLVKAGTRLGARQLGLAAGLGRHRLSVHPTPRVVIIAVGRELGDARRRGRAGSVPESNSHMLAVMAADAGANAYRVGAVSDDRITLRTTLEDQLVRADLVITTGGLSESSDETLPDVLRDLGQFDVHRVALMPGRRHGSGLVAVGQGEAGTRVFALPGHPAAAIVAFEMYVRPVLRTMSGYAEKHRPRVSVRSTSAWASPEGVVQCVPVLVDKLRDSGGSAKVVGDPWQPSLADFAIANALAVIPEGVTSVAVGDDVSCLVWDN